MNNVSEPTHANAALMQLKMKLPVEFETAHPLSAIFAAILPTTMSD